MARNMLTRIWIGHAVVLFILGLYLTAAGTPIDYSSPSGNAVLEIRDVEPTPVESGMKGIGFWIFLYGLANIIMILLLFGMNILQKEFS